jgi:potassium-transporting ATPase KdpC subunit
MKRNILSSIILTLILILSLGIGYPLLIRTIAYLSPGSGNGVETLVKNKVVGFDLIGQSFTADKYFQGRPSGVNYNAMGSGGTNKSIYNPEYIKVMQARVDTFLRHNPAVKKSEIPVELITASGSGLDPDISPAAAYVQVTRIAGVRSIEEEKLKQLISQMTVKPMLGFLGPEKVNVLKINVELDKLK